MVLAERNSELVRNGRRSRGPSPNGHNPNASGPGGGGGGGVSVGGGGLAIVSVGGTGTPETSSDDDNSIKRNGKAKAKQSEYEEKIRVGRDYQAVCPSLVPEVERKPEVLNDRALLVWSPTREIPDSKLEEYISVAKEKYGYNGEQALGMLFWHKHDLERAVLDLANFTPFPDEWTVEDKVLFEQAFQFHGKSFHRIRQMLPDKSIASLVKYYYSWKKTRHRQSVMDRQEKTKTSKEGSENGSDNGSNEDSDNDDKDQALATDHAKLATGSAPPLASDPEGEVINSFPSLIAATGVSGASVATANAIGAGGKLRQSMSPIGGRSATPMNGIGAAVPTGGGVAGGGGSGYCLNCGVMCNFLNASPHGRLCTSCHHHWRRTGNKRPTSGPSYGKRVRTRSVERHKRKPPRGMYINHDDIVALASDSGTKDALLANTDREIVSLLSQVQLNKQNISSLKRKNSENVEELRPMDAVSRINARWTNDEVLLAVQGVRKFGKDFQTIADTLGTKTEAHVRTFYMNYRRRYNLDQVLKKHEAEKDTTTASGGGAGAEPNANTNNNSNMNNNNNNSSSSGGGSGNGAGSATSKKEQDQPSLAAQQPQQQPSLKRKESATEEADHATTTGAPQAAGKGGGPSDEPKINPTGSNLLISSKKIIMEIDLDAEQTDAPPPAKKLALNVANQEYAKASAV